MAFMVQSLSSPSTNAWFLQKTSLAHHLDFFLVMNFVSFAFWRFENLRDSVGSVQGAGCVLAESIQSSIIFQSKLTLPKQVTSVSDCSQQTVTRLQNVGFIYRERTSGRVCSFMHRQKDNLQPASSHWLRGSCGFNG